MAFQVVLVGEKLTTALMTEHTSTSEKAVSDGGTAAQPAESEEAEIETEEREPYVGTEMKRVEDNRLLTGRGRFIDDMEPTPNIHHMAILRSPHAHAKVEDIDVSAALDLDGVKEVITGEDVAEETNPFPVTVENPPNDYYSMAVDRVRYNGEPVAVVVAESKYRAQDALEHVKVTYERLDLVMDPEEAAEDDAPQLHEAGNVATHRDLHYGDTDEAFQEADHVVSRRFEFPRTAAPPLETYGLVAEWDDSSEVLDLWANYQGPLSMNAVMSRALALPENKMRIKIPADQGGGFGVKTSIYPYMVLAAVASMKAEVPVKWIESRQEHLQAASHHASRVQYMEGAVDDDGTIRGVRFRQYDDYGAYIRPPEPGASFRSIGNWQGAYDIDGLSAEIYAVQTNKCPTGPNRGYSCHPHYFALEGIVDEMADEIGLDPAELRRRNLIDADAFPFNSLTGGQYDSGDYRRAFETGLEEVDYESRKEESGDTGDSYVGIGMSVVVDPHVSNMGYLEVARPAEDRSLPKSGASEIVTLIMGLDGSVKVDLTSLPEGHGHETTASQIVADELEIDPSDIEVNTGIDTGTQAWEISTGTYSSRFGSIGHKAISEAAKDVRSQIERIGAHLLGVDPSEATLTDGDVAAVNGDSVSLGRVAGTTYWNPSELPDDVEPKLATMKAVKLDTAQPVTDDDKMNSSQTYAFAGHFVVVEIDKETGEIDILDYVAVHDSGTIVNPMIVRGQIEGGALMGYANVLYEYHEYDDVGNLQTDTLMDYGMPTVKEAPQYRQKHLETPSPLTGIGSKGVGESATMAAIPALANAIQDAVREEGVEIDTLPLNPDRMWQTLQSSDD